ncbi:dihydrofolate reductase [Aestuariirhabdus litorea]|uniref:Dihydrofolate reductase n=1 Tax=Aestuariirhabdus litorea TaxID=2528527 RepID=A0A3P3VI32_9GAMM|nr:dihydrofolate reductase [Aestuariirhabdus litorea]RRJ82380.1 dihydrofolate reductase [Aestuariirhabdus litorea]RWW92543.1 dihydrofolate reductase [Endozoicomonadaceae bacterium GTF-13]
MKIAMIAAVAENGAIGINNKLPWYLPGDLRYFKAVTLGKPVIMGRKTFESLRKPLPGRTNIVISRNAHYQPEGVQVVQSLEQAIERAESVGLINGQPEMMVIGGEQIYRLALSKAERIYLTRVYQSFEGDAWFPELDPAQWREVQREDHFSEDEPPLRYSYLVLDRAES